jgi:hypothetical protein
MGGSAGNLGGFGSRFGNKGSGGFTNYKPPGGYFGGNTVGAGPQAPGNGPMGGQVFPGGERPGAYGVDGPSNPYLPKGYDPSQGQQIRPPMGGPLPPFQGGSMNAGPQAPGGSPMGGNMFPGGERPGAYGVPTDMMWRGPEPMPPQPIIGRSLIRGPRPRG